MKIIKLNRNNFRNLARDFVQKVGYIAPLVG